MSGIKFDTSELIRKILILSNFVFLVPLLFFTVGSTGLATIVGMNIILFYRIITSDYLKNNKDPASKTDEKINENSDNNSECVNEADQVANLAMQMKAAVHRRQPHNINRIVMSLFDEQEEALRSSSKWD